MIVGRSMISFFKRLFFRPKSIEIVEEEVMPVFISPTLIQLAMPKAHIDWFLPIQSVFSKYDISGHEAALLLSHIGHESNDLSRLVENMNYSADRLMQVWPSRFKTIERARQFERNAEKLANEVYGNRMGNTDTGDGWRFRGRGPLQITGKHNYLRLAKDTGIGCINDPDILVYDKTAGIESACWYWKTFVTARDLEGSTRQINGGLHGLADRSARYNRATG